ncbi:MAG: ABC transporter ATP-binding protein [Candidatus Omnitrophica bacterium]|nr:ABC transporter ATP-binding protein [Candidatus Omnitrophota bacterium]MBU1128416.1 ABC transporter ATP-binding protein [Candidatus Omnitrophota bacterium]MBU1656850.1 ABC transporter ATP-binding protein [Candidatus Omnitrophota bacterium]MBU1784755.1 ABC transporter ATP-binding protein [Candidatus Omnitrophota bacterium]MBU1852296.1 ABC transporter ATP-binding protein [Candidatus Omnitrophota bacterium]
MIELVNVRKSFNARPVLLDLNLSIKKGESLVIIGRSGCGKSVLLKHIIGLLRPDSGDVIVDGVNITKLDNRGLSRIRKKIGMLFQGSALFDSLTVFENVGFELIEHSEKNMEEIAERVAECLKMVGLHGIEELKPAELSGGMKKRVGLARAVCISPDIILFDEPTTGIDPIMGDIINNLIRYLHHKLNVTSITVTHDMKSAYKIADRICMFYDKKLVDVGTPEEARHSKSEIVRQFIDGAARGPLTEDTER